MTRCFLRKQTVRNRDLICLFSPHDCVCFLQSMIVLSPFSLSYNIIDTQNLYAKKSQMHSTPKNSNALPSSNQPACKYFLTFHKVESLYISKDDIKDYKFHTTLLSNMLILLTLRRLMSYIYMEHPFLMFLDHTQRRSTVGRTPLDE